MPIEYPKHGKLMIKCETTFGTALPIHDLLVKQEPYVPNNGSRTHFDGTVTSWDIDISSRSAVVSRCRHNSDLTTEILELHSIKIEAPTDARLE